MATTYYIRPDGGDHTVCDGTVDAPAPGTNGHCAWSHPFEALPPGGEPRIKGGDTLIIGHGTYIMGHIDGVYDSKQCYYKYPYTCRTSPIPSGPDPGNPTRILGEGWDAGCKNPPVLTGKSKAKAILDLTNSSNVVVRCLEITDMGSCGSNYKGTDAQLNCSSLDKTDGTPGDYALTGIFSGTNSKPYNTSSNVLLKDLYIHGMAGSAINAAHLTDWTFENLKIINNASAGFNGDVPPSKGENDAFSGTITFRNVEIGWSGCIEDKDTKERLKCYDQQLGGYGDGIGTGPAGNAKWVFENVYVHHNTSDGIDLLYMRYGEQAQVKIKKARVEGNAGNGIKVAGSLWLENSEIIANCDYWYDKPFAEDIIRCRGNGAGLSLSGTYESTSYVINNSFTGEPWAIIVASAESSANLGKIHHYFYNNLLQALPLFNNSNELADWMYAWHGVDPGKNLTNKYWLVYNAGQMSRYDLCNTEGTICNRDPKLKLLDVKNDLYDLHLASDTSAAIGHGLEAGTLLGYWGQDNEPVKIPTEDKDGNLRSGKTCIGAFERKITSADTGIISIKKILRLP